MKARAAAGLAAHRITAPFRTALAGRGMFLSTNDRRLWELKDRHRGEDAVVVGMGPSLRVSDLPRFKNHVSFGCNKIYLAYEQVGWRPDYYSVIDLLVAENNRDEITGLSGSTKIFPSWLRRELPSMEDVIFTPCHRQMLRYEEAPRYFDDPIKGIVTGGATVSLYMIQLAYWMGCQTVYLVGSDFSFQLACKTEEQTKVGEQIMVNKTEVNHFHKNYRKEGEKWSAPKMEVMAHGFSYARQAFRRDGRRLLNASRVTKLEALERVDFDEVFPAIK